MDKSGGSPGDANKHKQYPVIPIVNDLIKELENGDVDTIIAKFLDPGVLRTVKNSVNDPAPSVQKYAMYFLKSLTTFLLELDDEKLREASLQFSGILLLNGRTEFKKFWSDFFELLGIFDEKQYHIIEPFLVKFRSSKFQAIEAAPWLTVLVEKLLNHDNRMLAKEALNMFLNTALCQASTDSAGVAHYLEFLRSKVFPVLQDRVGWLLNSPAEILSTAEKLGLLVKLLQRLECDSRSSSLLLQWIVKTDAEMSPVATYFFTLAGFHDILGEVLPDSSIAMELMGNNLKTITYIVQYRLSAVDKYLKVKIQELLIGMVFKLWQRVPDTTSGSHYTGLHLSNYDLVSKSSGEVFQSVYSDLMLFWSVIDFNLLVPSIQEVHENLFKDGNGDNDWLLLKNWKPAQSIYCRVRSSPHRLRGFLRWFLFHLVPNSRDKSLKFENLGELVQELIGNVAKYPQEYEPADLFTLLDFCKFMVRIYPNNSEILEDAISRIAQQSLYGVLNLVDKLSNDELTIDQYLPRMEPLIKITRFTLPLCRNLEVNQQLARKLDDILKVELLPNNPCNAAILALLMNFCFTQNEKMSVEVVSTITEVLVEAEFRLNKNNFSCKHDVITKYNNLKILALQEILDDKNKCTTIFQSGKYLKALLEFCFDFVYTGSSENLSHVLRIINATLQFSHVNPDLDTWTRTAVKQNVESVWAAVKDLHKTEYFWDAVNAFASILANPFLPKGILTQYAAKVFELSESISGLPFVLTQKLSIVQLDRLCDGNFQDYLKEFLDVNIQASCIGPIIPKSMKLTYSLWKHLSETETSSKKEINYDQKLSFPFNGATKSRLLAVSNLIRFLEIAARNKEETLASIVNKLQEFNEGESLNKRRYFTGSQVHRVKQRIVQVLLVLQPLFDCELSRTVLKTLLLSLGKDGPQASVRYITEWIIINILSKYPSLHQEFFSISSQCFQVRPGFGCIFATIVLHTSTRFFPCTSTEVDNFYDIALYNLAGLLMGQNFTVRIYGNIALCKMYDQAVACKLNSILTKYQVVYNCAKEAVTCAAGNFRKIFENVSEDFYLKTFLPRKHYFLDVIFIHLPKLAKMSCDEIIQEHDLNLIANENLPCLSPVEVQDLYKRDTEYFWHLQSNLIDGREQGEESALINTLEDVTENSLSTTLQVKGNPWKYLPTSDELLMDFSEEIQLKRKDKEDGLVVVASLIDRIPNLGGLCRTCEVFGASKYVISSLKVLDDQQFKSLSVSAHRWVDILEVPEHDLKNFLLSYSSKGYTIVGVEQALDSTKLNTFSFPKKSVLLLGNEKYGIPTNLLGLVDNCVEIPQAGLIRSLNVHVTGALCIWHYASQHVV